MLCNHLKLYLNETILKQYTSKEEATCISSPVLAKQLAGGLRSCWHCDLGVGGGHYQGPLPTGSGRESRISVTKGNPLLVCRG